MAVLGSARHARISEQQINRQSSARDSAYSIRREDDPAVGTAARHPARELCHRQERSKEVDAQHRVELLRLGLEGGLKHKMPAFGTGKFTGPSSASISSAAACSRTASVTSAAIPSARLPVDSWTSRAAARVCSSSRSTSATAAPWAARRVSMLSPMPRAAPVTTAVRFSNNGIARFCVIVHPVLSRSPAWRRADGFVARRELGETAIGPASDGGAPVRDGTLQPLVLATSVRSRRPFTDPTAQYEARSGACPMIAPCLLVFLSGVRVRRRPSRRSAPHRRAPCSTRRVLPPSTRVRCHRARRPSRLRGLHCRAPPVPSSC